MILYRQALAMIEEVARSRRLEQLTVPLEASLGHVSACALASPEDVPSFDNSSMDGFALCAQLTESASAATPVRFCIAGCISAGEPPESFAAQPSGSSAQPSVVSAQNLPLAWEIMTGAPMPASVSGCVFNAVVKVEDVRVRRDARGRALEIEVLSPLKALENVRGKGEDFAVSQRVLGAHMLLMPEHLMALASLGIAQVPVYRRPRVAILSTGKEVVPHAQKNLPFGQIRNSTAPYLLAAFSRFGADVKSYGGIDDDPALFKRVLAEMCEGQPDVIVTTGAVSMGKHDFMKDALLAEGARLHYHKVAIRPGKPGLFAELPGGLGRPGPVVFGLPGNPISTVVGLRFFIGPYLRALRGLSPERSRPAQLHATTSKPEGLRCFFKARVSEGLNATTVRALAGQPSFMVSPLLRANAWVVFAEEGAAVAGGTPVDVYPIYPNEGADDEDQNESEALRGVSPGHGRCC